MAAVVAAPRLPNPEIRQYGLTLFPLDPYHRDAPEWVTLSGSCSREYMGILLVPKNFLSITLAYIGQRGRRAEQALAARTHAGQG